MVTGSLCVANGSARPWVAWVSAYNDVCWIMRRFRWISFSSGAGRNRRGRVDGLLGGSDLQYLNYANPPTTSPSYPFQSESESYQANGNQVPAFPKKINPPLNANLLLFIPLRISCPIQKQHITLSIPPFWQRTSALNQMVVRLERFFKKWARRRWVTKVRLQGMIKVSIERS